MNYNNIENTVVKTLLTIGLTLSGGFLLFNIYQLVDNHGVARSLREEVIQFKNLSSNSEGFLKTKDDINDEIDSVLDFIFVKEQTQKDFLSFLIRSGGSVGASVRIGQSEPYESGQEFQVVPLIISVKGSYSDIVEYLSRIENSQYYVYFDKLDLKSIDDEDLSVVGEIKGHLFRRGI